MISLLIYPFIACIILTLIHVYFGVHILRRGIIFIDLALAQFAAFGGLVASFFIRGEPHLACYGVSFLFTLVGAFIFSATSRFSHTRQEAMIGIWYALLSAISIIFISRFGLDPHEIQHMLVGDLLFVTPEDIIFSTLLYSAIGIIHWIFRQEFFTRLHSRLWQFLFYATFGLVVTSSVKLGGVLLVFSFLIIPVFISSLFAASVKRIVAWGWGLGIIGSLIGLAASVALDIPTGASIICALGIMFIIAVMLCYHVRPYDTESLF
jgi:zinc/manganese transport system permease protein